MKHPNAFSATTLSSDELPAMDPSSVASVPSGGLTDRDLLHLAYLDMAHVRHYVAIALGRLDRVGPPNGDFPFLDRAKATVMLAELIGKVRVLMTVFKVAGERCDGVY